MLGARTLTELLPDNNVDDDMPLSIRLSLITLGVSDVDRATRFYETLGLVRSSASTDEVSFFEAGGVVLSIYGLDALRTDAQLGPQRPGQGGQTLAWNVPSEGEVDKAIVRIVAAGGRLVRAGERAHWGGYVAYATDPDGHVWEVAHNPGFALEEDGRLIPPR